MVECQILNYLTLLKIILNICLILILNIVFEQYNKIIIDLKDTILDLQQKIKNNDNHNDRNTILYSSMVTKNLDEIKFTINDTVTTNIENIYEDSNRKKTLIIYNIEKKNVIKK